MQRNATFVTHLTLAQMSGLFSWLGLHKLKPYFHVSNQYVVNKIKYGD